MTIHEKIAYTENMIDAPTAYLEAVREDFQHKILNVNDLNDRKWLLNALKVINAILAKRA